MLKNQDTVSGILLAIVGIFISVYSHQYSFGELSNIGPGFFPTVLGILLFVFGSIIAVTSIKNNKEQIYLDFKSMLCVILGILLFNFTVESIGLILSTVLSVLFFMYPVPIKVYKKILLGLAISFFNYFVFVMLLEVVI